MAYEYGSGWNDITELKCLLIMKKLVLIKGTAEKFPRGPQADFCRELVIELKKIGNPLDYGSISAKVSNYKSAAGYNEQHKTSRNTKDLYEKYKKHTIKELELVIIKMQEETWHENDFNKQVRDKEMSEDMTKEEIKQYTYHFSGLYEPVYARIVKNKDGKFGWEISYHYKPSRNAKIYYPSTVSGNSFTEVEEHLEMYVKNFTADFGVKKNLDFIFDSEISENDLARKNRISELVKWFYENYQIPAKGGLYQESKEGGFHGDIRDASDELQGTFPFAGDDIIMAAVEEIESHGGPDWTPIYGSKASLIDELNTLIDSAPKTKTDPAFILGDDNLFYITPPPDNQPADSQDDLLDELRTIIDDLLESLVGANAHSDLIPIIKRYKEAISGNQISISRIYARGRRLDNALQITKNRIESEGIQLLRQSTQTDLETALEIHGNYIMSSAEGRQLVQDAADYRQSAEQTEALKEASEQLANTITESRNLFGEDVREHIRDVLIDIAQGRHPERSNQGVINTLTNFVSDIFKAGGKDAVMAIIGVSVATSVPGMATSALGAEAINAVGFFLLNNAHLLSMLAIPLAGEQSWLASAAHLLERIKLMFKNKN